ncbi:c-type cytochrome [Thiolapillus sp.]
MKKNILFFAIAAGIIGSVNVFANPDQDESINKGREHFKIFCSNCHGVNADGRGPLVETLKITPADLTALKQTGDACVAERVLKAVAGKHDVAAGQKKNMPNFSHNLESITIYEITQYLKSIQK